MHRAGTKEKESQAQQPREARRTSTVCKGQIHRCHSEQGDSHVLHALSSQKPASWEHSAGGRTAGSIPRESSEGSTPAGLQGGGTRALGPLGSVQGELAVTTRITGILLNLPTGSSDLRPREGGYRLQSPDLMLPNQSAGPCLGCTLHPSSFSRRCLRGALPY